MTHTRRMCRPRRHAARPGMILVSVLTCLAIAMLLFTVWMRTALLEQRQLRSQQDRIQAELLVDAALSRAAAQLQASADYTGETWQIDAESLSGQGAAGVTIEVTPGEGADARKVQAVAEYPLEADARIRRAKQIIVKLPGRGESP